MTRMPGPMTQSMRSLLLAVATLAGTAPALGAEAQAPTPEQPATAATTAVPPEQRWSSFLPLMAEEARQRGYELPLPFGASAIYNYLERDIEVADLSIGVNGAPLRSVSDYVDLGSNSRVNVALARFDAWILPFLNVYGLLGHIDNASTTRALVTVPLPGPIPGSRTFEFTGDTGLTGVVGGGGLTVAAGYKEFFLMADVNYTQTDIGFDDSFRAMVLSMRSGWNGLVGNRTVRAWAGLMYWDTRNIARSTVEVPGIGRVSFEADQGPKNPWNPSIGASVAFTRHWEAMAEYGFNFDDVKVFLAGASYRF